MHKEVKWRFKSWGIPKSPILKWSNDLDDLGVPPVPPNGYTTSWWYDMVMSVWTGLGLVPVVHTVGTLAYPFRGQWESLSEPVWTVSEQAFVLEGWMVSYMLVHNPGCFKETDLVCRVTVSWSRPASHVSHATSSSKIWITTTLQTYIFSFDPSTIYP